VYILPKNPPLGSIPTSPACPELGAERQVYKYDVSLPLQRMYELVEETRVKLQAAGVEADDKGDGEEGMLWWLFRY